MARYLFDNRAVSWFSPTTEPGSREVGGHGQRFSLPVAMEYAQAVTGAHKAPRSIASLASDSDHAELSAAWVAQNEQEFERQNRRDILAKDAAWRRKQPRRKELRKSQVVQEEAEKPSVPVAIRPVDEKFRVVRRQTTGQTQLAAVIAMNHSASRQTERRNRTHLVSLLAIVSILCAVASNEVLYNYGDTHKAIPMLKTVVSMCSVVMVGCILQGYYETFRIGRLGRTLLPHDWAAQFRLVVECSLEVLICGFHSPPTYNGFIELDTFGAMKRYNFDSIACFFVTFRCYVFLRSFREHLVSQDPIIRAAARQSGINLNRMGLFLKRELDLRPASFLGFILILVLVWMAYLVRICELPMHEDVYIYYWSSLWLVIVSMSPLSHLQLYRAPRTKISRYLCSVGYGDLFPETSLGRASTIFAVMAGMFLTSMSVTMFGYVSALDPTQRRVTMIAQQVAKEERVLNQAALCLQVAWLRMKAVRVSTQMKGRSLERERLRYMCEQRAKFVFRQFRAMRVAITRQEQTKSGLEVAIEKTQDELRATIAWVEKSMTRVESVTKQMTAISESLLAAEEVNTQRLAQMVKVLRPATQEED